MNLFTDYYYVANKIILDYSIHDNVQFSSRGTVRAEPTMRVTHVTWLLLVLLLLGPGAHGRRGRARSRTKSRVQIGLPITGKYRDPESDQYYNNSNVRT
jgi:hypothetical protein